MSNELSLLFVQIYSSISAKETFMYKVVLCFDSHTWSLLWGTLKMLWSSTIHQNARQVFCYYELDWNFNWSQSSIPLLFSLLIFVDTGQGMQN